MHVRIEGGCALIDAQFASAAIHVSPDGGGTISHIDGTEHADMHLDADGLLILPGIVDIHGDSLERQMMPRPTAEFPIDVALLECDRQAIANGITTLFHGVTWSWEPGLRGAERARAVLESMERLRPQLAADTQHHLRHEIYNLDDEDEIIDWLRQGRVAAFAFNDHMSLNLGVPGREKKVAEMIARSGLSRDDFLHHAERVKARAAQVPQSIARLAAIAVESGVPLMSHDDTSVDQRRWFRSLGCLVAEFPTNAETAEEAAKHGDHIVFGAPNVVRGGSHAGWVRATEMVRRGLCSVLASDYYYPSQLLAAFRLASEKVLPLKNAWPLVSEKPAAAVGLGDRGCIATGKRADMILVDDQIANRPRVVATVVRGRVVHLTEAWRLARPATRRSMLERAVG